MMSPAARSRQLQEREDCIASIADGMMLELVETRDATQKVREFLQAFRGAGIDIDSPKKKRRK